MEESKRSNDNAVGASTSNESSAPAPGPFTFAFGQAMQFGAATATTTTASVAAGFQVLAAAEAAESDGSEEAESAPVRTSGRTKATASVSVSQGRAFKIPPGPPPMDMDTFGKLSPMKQLKEIHGLLEVPFFAAPSFGKEKAVALLSHLESSVPGVQAKAVRVLLDYNLQHSELVNDMVEAGLLAVISRILTSCDSSGIVGNLMHCLCRMVKDSQEALMAMADTTCGLSEAVSIAMIKAAQGQLTDKAEGDVNGAGAATGDGANEAEEEEDGEEREQEDDDPFDQGCDFYYEMWARLPQAKQEVQDYWGKYSGPALAAVLEYRDKDGGTAGALQATRPALIMIRLEARRARKAGTPQDTPLLKQMLPMLSSVACYGFVNDDPDSFMNDRPPRLAASIASLGPEAAGQLLADGAGPSIPKWLASKRPEIATSTAEFLGNLLGHGPAVALAVLRSDPAMPSAVVNVITKPCAEMSEELKEKIKKEGSMHDDSLWWWDAQMRVLGGLAHGWCKPAASTTTATAKPKPEAKPPAAKGAGEDSEDDEEEEEESEDEEEAEAAPSASDTAAEGPLASLCIANGMVPALLTVLDKAKPASGGFGRPLGLMLKHALVTLQALLRVAPEAVKPQPDVRDLLARVLSRPELQPEAPPADEAAARRKKANARLNHTGLFPYENEPHDAAALTALTQQLIAAS